MADKLGLGSEIKEFNLGSSFTNSRGSAFHTFRYDFKPASVDTSKMATVDILPNNEVNVTVPHCDGAGTAQTSVFRGPKKSHTKECVLIIDHNTGEITLERLSHNIQLKKTRAEGTTKAGQSLSPADTVQMPHGYQSRKLSPNHSHKSPTASVSPTLSPSYSSPQGMKVSPKQNQGLPSKRSSMSPVMPYSNSHVSLPGSMPTLDQMGMDVTGLEEDEHDVGVLSESSSSSDSDSSSDSSASETEDSDNDRTKFQETGNVPNSSLRNLVNASNSPVAHLSMPSHLLSEDLRLSDSGSDSD